MTTTVSAEEREKTFLHCLGEIYHWARCMDRILFRKNLRQLVEYVANESAAFQLTTKEQRKWKAIVDSAMAESRPAALASHWRAIGEFWDSYQQSG